MKAAIGYLADDGKFFESEIEAEEYEAWRSLRVALFGVGGVDVEENLKVIATIPNEIRRYINANEAAIRYRETQAGVCSEDTTGREANDEAVLEQQTRIDEPLPDVGGREFQKEVQLERTINGSGSGRIDAPNVRSSEDMATRAHTEPTKTCNPHRTSNIRKGKVE